MKQSTKKRAATKKTAKRSSSNSKTKASEGALDALLGPTALVYAQEELAILGRVAKHPALGGAAIHRWSLRSKPGIPKRDLPAFTEAMADVDVAARVRLVVKKLEKAWRTKLDPETVASVREDIEGMYRGK
jgi:hypothetical protein